MSQDKPTERALKLFIARVSERFPVREALLFGSRARGDHQPDSDADVAVLLAGDPGDRFAVNLAMADIAFDVMLEAEVLISPLPVWQYEWEHPAAYPNPSLIETIKREGVRL